MRQLSRCSAKGFESPEPKLDRTVVHCSLTPLFGRTQEFASLAQLKNFLASFDPAAAVASLDFKSFLLLVRYSNGDRMECSFGSVASLLDFLRKL
jgi:hypothetical protein